MTSTSTRFPSRPHYQGLVAVFVVLFVLTPLAPAFAAVTPPSIPNPNVFTDVAAPRVDGASGAYTQSVPLDLPPGRNGLQPNLSLSYNSQNTDQDDLVGYGWSLNIPYVQRLNKTGSQDMYGANVVFTSSLDGELTNLSPATINALNVLVVAGGGGGGNAPYGGGGGGGGGVIASSTYMVTPQTYQVTVGAGGSSNGGNSVFGSLTAIGGGAGGANANGSGNGGGAGGGGTCTGQGGAGTPGQGYGGAAGLSNSTCGGGGGGGAGGLGFQAQGPAYGGNGGTGFYSAITGTGVIYGGGGGGGANNKNFASPGTGGSGGGGTGGNYSNAGNGTPNTGGGGGGGGQGYTVGAGGSGIVIISYPTTAASSYICGGTVSVSGLNTICTFTSSGTFTVKNSGSGSGYPPQTYAARIDDGSFHLYSYSTSTNRWTMSDKNGTQYYFGASSQSQMSATTSPSQVYKWMLEKVVDTNGNYIHYVYTKDGNQIYPSQIIYTGNGSTDGPITISFTTAARPDAHNDYTAGFKVWTNYRISQITASVNGTKVRQYTLGYTTGNNGTRSLLASVQETGWNDSGVQTTLPPETFSYASSTTPFVSQKGFIGQAYVVADVNGDGVNDVTVAYSQPVAGGYGVNIAPSIGSVTSVSVPTVWALGGSSITPIENGTRLVDVNGSGKASIINGFYNYTTGAQSGTLYSNGYTSSNPNAYSWNANPTYQGVIPIFAEDGSGSMPSMTTGLFGDVNGTGLPSYVMSVSGGIFPSNVQQGTYLANGSAWNPPSTSVFNVPIALPNPLNPAPTNPQLIDINGDGLADIVYSDSSKTYVLLNTGSGWETTPDPEWTIGTSTLYWAGNNPYGQGVYYDRGIRFIDVNGDGLPDMVHSYTYTPFTASIDGAPPGPENATYNVVYLNTGHGFATSAITIPGYITTATAQSGYWGGTFTNNEYANFIGNGQINQDVLTHVTYPKGGSTDITYGNTTQSGTNTQLPYNILVATKVINHDGRGSNEETDYSYSGGKQYLPTNVFDRKFAGFATVTETRPDRTTTTYYSQGTANLTLGDQSDGYPQLNHPYRKDTLTPSGTLTQKLFYRYNSYLHGASAFVGLGRQVEQDYAGRRHASRQGDRLYIFKHHRRSAAAN